MPQAIDNTNLINVFNGQANVAGFTPAGTYVYDAAAATVVITDATTIPSGDTLAVIHYQVFDKFGGEVKDKVTATGGAKTLNVASLNKSKPLDIKVTVVTTQNRVADGGAYNIGAAGALGFYDKQKNAVP